MGFLPIFKSDLGILLVNGDKRIPLPPAMIMASKGKNDFILLKLITFIILLLSSNIGITLYPDFRKVISSLRAIFFS